MTISHRCLLAGTCSAAVLMAATAPARAQAQKAPGWTATANLSGVATSGNSSTRSLGGKLRLDRNWLRTVFFVEGGGVYQAAREGEIFALGTPASYEFVDERDMVTKAEKYFAETGFERRVTEKFYWTLGAGWRRDIFSGVEHQASARGGVGYVDVSPRSEFKAAALATYSDQQDLVEDPELDSPFFGGRMTFDYLKKFGEEARSQFHTFLAVDQNFQTSDDTRLLWENALTVTMTARLALQVGYILSWRNLPAYEEVTVLSLRPPDGVSTGTVLRRLEKLDQTFQVSLVVNWSPRPPSAARPTP
jgi:Protein of unknown function, DUF481